MTTPLASVQNRVEVASFDSYSEAERAVDSLSDQGFPVQYATIMGVGLRSVEQVLGRLTYLRAAGMGAVAGAWFGLLIGIFLALFTNNVVWWLGTILWALLWGAVAGAVFGLVAHALSGGRRDFFSASQLVAERYEVLVESTHAERARELLASRRP